MRQHDDQREWECESKRNDNVRISTNDLNEFPADLRGIHRVDIGVDFDFKRDNLAWETQIRHANFQREKRDPRCIRDDPSRQHRAAFAVARDYQQIESARLVRVLLGFLFRVNDQHCRDNCWIIVRNSVLNEYRIDFECVDRECACYLACSSRRWINKLRDCESFSDCDVNAFDGIHVAAERVERVVRRTRVLANEC